MSGFANIEIVDKQVVVRTHSEILPESVQEMLWDRYLLQSECPIPRNMWGEVSETNRRIIQAKMTQLIEAEEEKWRGADETERLKYE